jgi:hypothetical protein
MPVPNNIDSLRGIQLSRDYKKVKFDKRDKGAKSVTLSLEGMNVWQARQVDKRVLIHRPRCVD